jgi:hypothetical protein
MAPSNAATPLSQVKSEAVEIKSEPMLETEEKAETEEEKKDRVEKAAEGGSKKGGWFSKGGKKFKIKLGRIGFVIADVERWVHEKTHLNKMMQPAEIDADYTETYADTKEIIDNRINIESEWGDVINLGITLAAHIGKRAARYYTSKTKRALADNAAAEEGGGAEGEETGERKYSSVIEEAQAISDQHIRRTGNADLSPH